MRVHFTFEKKKTFFMQKYIIFTYILLLKKYFFHAKIYYMHVHFTFEKNTFFMQKYLTFSSAIICLSMLIPELGRCSDGPRRACMFTNGYKKYIKTTFKKF